MKRPHEDDDAEQAEDNVTPTHGPQIIVLADTRCCQQTAATVAARPGWSTIAAVRRHRVVGVGDDIASRWGPRIVEFARQVAKIARRSG